MSLVENASQPATPKKPAKIRPIEPGSFTIPEWCKRHGFCRAFFYKLQARDAAPRVFRTGRTVRITPEADSEWVAAREAASHSAIA